MLLPLPQNCLQPSHKSDKERNRSVGRGGDGMRGRGEIKEWQRRVTEEDGGARKWKGGGAGGGLQWLVCLVRFVFSLSALLSIHPSCWDRKRWKCEDSSAGSSWEERWSAAPAGTTRSIAGGGGVGVGENSLSWTTSWIPNATFAFHWLQWSVIRRLPEKHLQSDLKYYRNSLMGAILEFIDLARCNESQF